MADLDLDALEKLLGEATPRPWAWEGGILVWGTPSRECIIWPDNAVGDSSDPASHLGALGHNTEPAAAANKALIVALRNAAPALLSLARTASADAERLDWLDQHCAFVADGQYNIGPYRVGELRKMADAGIAADRRTSQISDEGKALLTKSEGTGAARVPSGSDLERARVCSDECDLAGLTEDHSKDETACIAHIAAELARAREEEREECAKVVEDTDVVRGGQHTYEPWEDAQATLGAAAKAIRARATDRQEVGDADAAGQSAVVGDGTAPQHSGAPDAAGGGRAGGGDRSEQALGGDLLGARPEHTAGGRVGAAATRARASQASPAKHECDATGKIDRVLYILTDEWEGPEHPLVAKAVQVLLFGEASPASSGQEVVNVAENSRGSDRAPVLAGQGEPGAGSSARRGADRPVDVAPDQSPDHIPAGRRGVSREAEASAIAGRGGKVHRCMRCGGEFACRTAGCEAKYDVLPRIVQRAADGSVEVVEHECVKPPGEQGKADAPAAAQDVAKLLGRGHVENPREGEPGDAETYPAQEPEQGEARGEGAEAAIQRVLALWSEFTSQEMYGEMLRGGMEREHFALWQLAHESLRRQSGAGALQRILARIGYFRRDSGDTATSLCADIEAIAAPPATRKGE